MCAEPSGAFHSECGSVPQAEGDLAQRYATTPIQWAAGLINACPHGRLIPSMEIQ